jgi:hypothetical protein
VEDDEVGRHRQLIDSHGLWAPDRDGFVAVGIDTKMINLTKEDLKNEKHFDEDLSRRNPVRDSCSVERCFSLSGV